MNSSAKRVAVVLFNLGGPDGPEAVRPFLFNLFNDKWIIAAPAPIRWALAMLISATRAKSARANYAKMGGGSPIVPETQAQVDALQAVLDERLAMGTAKVFMAMRYWKPFAEDTAIAVRAFAPDAVVLLPLYPQFSSSTTLTAKEAWAKAWGGLFKTVCCYPAGDRFAQAHADAILDAWRAGGEPANPRVLFSAHGLPERTIARGDSYQWQVERTVAAVRAKLPADWDSVICYQSRVGPLKWIGPPTDAEIRRAGSDGVGVIVSPIAFVSEHIETLVELDEEYAEVGHEAHLPFYLRVKALGARATFIAALADQVERALADDRAVRSEEGVRLCPGAFGLCPHHVEKAA